MQDNKCSNNHSKFKDFFISKKQKLLFLYFAYNVGYAFIFFLDHSTFYFEHWLFIFIVVYLINTIVISSIKRFKKNIEYMLASTLIAIAFYLSKESNFNLDLLIKASNDLTLSICKLILNVYFYIFIVISILYFIVRYYSEVSFIKEEKEELYEDRIKDKELILNFLKGEDKFNVLGVEEGFGVGKTFVVNQALKDLDATKYEIIKIRCLLLDKEGVYPYIIKQLNRILINNLIFEGHFEKLKASLIKSIDSKYLGLFSLFIKESSIDDIENFKQALFKLNKTIVLVFDDIDRNSNCEKIEKLFSFIDDFSENNIKSLVLFSSSNLKSISPTYSRSYVEKYIHFIMNLTPINLRKTLEQEIEIANLDKKDFFFIIAIFFDNFVYEDHSKKNEELKFYYDFQAITSLKISFNGNAFNFSIRKIKHFIEEVKLYLNSDLVIDRRLIIAYIFCKNFFYEEFYEKIDNIFSSFEETFPIHLKLKESDINLLFEDYDILYNLANHKINHIHEFKL